MTKVVNTRNKAEFELISISEVGVKLRDVNSDREKMITNEVYNRWYKVINEDDENPQDVQPMVQEENVVNEEDDGEKPKGKVGRPKKATVPKEPKSKDPHILKEVLEKILKALDLEIFVTKVKGFRTVKVGGHMLMAYTFSTKGIVLWMRSQAVDSLGLQFTTMKHMFDRRLTLRDNTEEVVEVIRKVVAASLQYQKCKNEEKAAKEQANKEKEQQKEVKREERKKKSMEAKFGVKKKSKKQVEEEQHVTEENKQEVEE